jgi:hypothetical protein
MANILPGYVFPWSEQPLAKSQLDLELGRYLGIASCCGSISVDSLDNPNFDKVNLNKGVVMSVNDQPSKLVSCDEYKIEAIQVGDTWLNFMLRQIP